MKQLNLLALFCLLLVVSVALVTGRTVQAKTTSTPTPAAAGGTANSLPPPLCPPFCPDGK